MNGCSVKEESLLVLILIRSLYHYFCMVSSCLEDLDSTEIMVDDAGSLVLVTPSRLRSENSYPYFEAFCQDR